jgi:DNA-binding transcriptional ArsR family regulator
MLTDQSAGRYAAKASKLLAVMANGKRMLVLELISNQEISVGQLAVMAGLSPSALSQHLAKLRGFKLVETRRDARTVFRHFTRYSAEPYRRFQRSMWPIHFEFR